MANSQDVHEEKIGCLEKLSACVSCSEERIMRVAFACIVVISIVGMVLGLGGVAGWFRLHEVRALSLMIFSSTTLLVALIVRNYPQFKVSSEPVSAEKIEEWKESKGHDLSKKLKQIEPQLSHLDRAIFKMRHEAQARLHRLRKESSVSEEHQEDYNRASDAIEDMGHLILRKEQVMQQLERGGELPSIEHNELRKELRSLTSRLGKLAGDLRIYLRMDEG